MNTKSKLYSLTVISALFCSNAAISQDISPRCTESKSALTSLEKKIFDQGFLKDSPLTLRDLEIEKTKLQAKKAILETFSNIHKQREDFIKRLNPTDPNSFYSKSMNAKTAVQETQKQIMSNYILSSITGSISAILEKDNFLETEDQEILDSPEWKAADTKYKKFKILSKNNPYEYMKSRCQQLELGNNQQDPCTNFTDIKEKKLLTIFSQTNQDMVGDVTNNFFKAYEVANAEGKDTDSILRDIQKEQITDYIDIDDLNEERTTLISSLLEENKNDGILDKENLSDFFRVSSIDSQSDSFSNNPLKSRSPSTNNIKTVESIKKVEDDFESAKKCYAKKVFGVAINCNGDKSISKFFDKINDLGFSKANYNDKEFKQQTFENEDVKKFNAKEITANAAKKELETIAMLGGTSKVEKYSQMKEICSGLKPFTSSSFAESLWDCVDKVNKGKDSDSGIAEKKSKLDTTINEIEKKIQLTRDSANNKYGDLLKYAALTAKEYCKDTPESYRGSCVGSDNKITSLVFGNKSFLTSLDNIEWNMSGKKETEKILSDVSAQCDPIANNSRKKENADKQVKEKATTKEDSSLLNICSYAKIDLKNLARRTPTEKQIAFRNNYISAYDSRTGKMKHTQKTGLGSMIASSAGTSLVKYGLPLYLQNATLKNNLPYQTDMAMYQKNYMYMMSNPQYWFSGYGLSSSYSGYTTGSSYYNFSN